MEIALTPEQSVRIRLLSDGPMYEDAVDLAAEQQAIIAYRQFGHQVNGLQQHARSFKELREFVKHQRTRDWEGKSQSFEGFYTAVDAYLNDVCNAVQEEYSFVPEGLTKNEKREWTDFFAGVLAREFVQHLSAEMMWQAWQKKEKGS